MPVQQISITEFEGVAGTESDCCKPVIFVRQEIALLQTRLADAQARLITTTAERRPMLVSIAEAHAVTPPGGSVLDIIKQGPDYKLTITT